MKKTELQKILINNGYDEDEFKDVIEEMRERILEGEDADEVLYEYGLEPDYIMDIVDGQNY